MGTGRQSEANAEPGSVSQVMAFEYPASAGAPAAPMWQGWPPGSECGQAADAKAADAVLRAEFDQRLAAEVRKAFESGRERGRQEGLQAGREAQAAAEQQRRRQGAELSAAFAAERDRYLHEVEHEVVELALAVAARILRREAQMDPLLLTGAVRVALGQISETTQVRLRVPPPELDLWTEAVALVPNLPVKPEVIAGEGMRTGDCAVETSLGTVDLGIRAQLGEIEHGFFDRAGSRRNANLDPAAESASPGASRRPI